MQVLAINVINEECLSRYIIILFRPADATIHLRDSYRADNYVLLVSVLPIATQYLVLEGTANVSRTLEM